MEGFHAVDNDFISKITEIIEENISNTQFGVSELAHETGMSRSNLLRKVKKLTKLSVSQFIRQIRLKHAMELLTQGSLTVSEISFRVGFNSTSYFIKCFHDHYGYPPGEAGKREHSYKDSKTDRSVRNRRALLPASTIIFVVAAIILLIIFKPFSSKQHEIEKTIAVLPFKNDSNDSSNVYIINGLMESILNNLQKIEDLEVTSRTSVEKYRNMPSIIPEIAKELNVNYFVEGSGQKIGDQILLNVQLIEASTDKHIWAEQYKREVKDIFQLQMEVAKSIADEIQAIITPEEERRISKVPTENLEAYDNLLKGLDQMYKGSSDNLVNAINYFKKAIEYDNDFARAYAGLAITYYFLDMSQTEKRFSDLINSYSDKALLLDPQLEQSLIAKAVYYMNNDEYESAVSYLEKALEYNPNSALVINILSDFYTSYIPNTEKYLEYALKGVKIDIASNDSINASFIYLHLSNAFIQSGFINEAVKHINRSLDYYPDNSYSQYVKAYILYARDRDMNQIKESLITVLNKDSSRLDVLQEVGKICYFMRDYESSYYYYRQFIDIKDEMNLDIYPSENAKIGVVLSEMGKNEEAERHFNLFKNFAENDLSIYKNLNLSMYYSYTGDTENAIEYFRLFSKERNFHYWTIIFLSLDPLMDNMKDHPEFSSLQSDLEINFWDYHKKIRASLMEKQLLDF